MSVRHAVLALLSERPKYGLQLKQEFEAGTGEVWPLNVGQVYTTLQRLDRDGLVESDADGGGDEGPQRVYRITASGRQELASWLGPPSGTTNPPRDELVIKVLIALCIPGMDVAEVIQSHRRWLIEAMQYFTHLKEDACADDIGLLVVADAEIYRLDAVVRWLDSTESRLRHLPRPTFPAAAPVSPRRTPRMGALR